MKQQIKKLFMVVIVLGLVLSTLSGCGSKEEKKEGTTAADTTAADTEVTTAEAAAPVEVEVTLADPNVTILYHTTYEAYQESLANNPNHFDPVWSNKVAFEEKFGGALNVIAVPWGDMKTQLIAMVNAGEQCDIAQANDQNFPIYPVKKLVQPISQYMDMNDPLWYQSVTNAFTYGGEAYAVGTDSTPIVLYYNKTLFENNGVKTPAQYYAEGNWNWDTFKEVALELTQDTDGDGVNDQYGFGWWDGDYNLFLTSNGLTNLVYNADGTIGTNYDKAEAIEAIEFVQNAYIKDKYIDASKSGDYFIAEFKNGKLAMTCEYGFGGFNTYASDNEIDFVPFPTGPKGTKDVGLGGLSGWSVPTSSKNPQGAAEFIKMMSQSFEEYKQTMNVEQYGQEKVDLINNLAQNILFVPIGIDKYWDANWTVVSALRDGTPVGTFLPQATDVINEGVKTTFEQ